MLIDSLTVMNSIGTAYRGATLLTNVLQGTAAVPKQIAALIQDIPLYGEMHRFIPALERIERTGDGVRSLRKKFFVDGQNLVVEQRNSRDDQAMHMTWTLIYNTLGIDNLWAAMRVEPLTALRAE